MWVDDYFVKEMGMQIVSDELVIHRAGKSFYLHHGDGLGPGDKNYRILRKIFRNPVCHWLFSLLPPSIGLGIANGWSVKSRNVNVRHEEPYLGDNEEWLSVYSREMLVKQHYDYFIYGHRHLPMVIDLGNNSKYYNTGDWFYYNSYVVFDGEELSLKYFEKSEA